MRMMMFVSVAAGAMNVCPFARLPVIFAFTDRRGDCSFLLHVLIPLKIENKKMPIIITKNSITNVGIPLNNASSGKKSASA